MATKGTRSRHSRRNGSSGGGETYMVLRTLYMPPSLDSFLRRRAMREGKSKNEVIREILIRAKEDLAVHA